MGRREFIAALGGGAAWPFVALGLSRFKPVEINSQMMQLRDV
jgi:hypothetical protein